METNKLNMNVYLEKITSNASTYEQTTLWMFDKVAACKSSQEKKDELVIYLNGNHVDIWAISTKCVTYPKPLNLYLIGNGNGNANDIVDNIMEQKWDDKIASFQKQLYYHVIKQNKKAIKALCFYGSGRVDLNKKCSETGFTALQLAIANKSAPSFLSFLLKSGPLLDIQDDEFGRTAIHFAIETMDLEIIKLVLQNATPQQVNQVDHNGIPPLACLYFNYNIGFEEDKNQIENLLVNHGAKYSLLKPFINRINSLLAISEFTEIQNKIYESIVHDMQEVQLENDKLRFELSHANDQHSKIEELTLEIDKNKMTYYHQRNQDIDMHKKQIEELHESFIKQQNMDAEKFDKEINDLRCTVKFQQKILQIISDQTNTQKRRFSKNI